MRKLLKCCCSIMLVLPEEFNNVFIFLTERHFRKWLKINDVGPNYYYVNDLTNKFLQGLFLTKLIDFYYRCFCVNFICFNQLAYCMSYNDFSMGALFYASQCISIKNDKVSQYF